MSSFGYSTTMLFSAVSRGAAPSHTGVVCVFMLCTVLGTSRNYFTTFFIFFQYFIFVLTKNLQLFFLSYRIFSEYSVIDRYFIPKASNFMRKRYRFSKRRKNKKQRLITSIIIAVVAAVTVSAITLSGITPLLREVAASEAQKTALRIINQSISKRLTESKTDYDDLSSVKYDANGKVSMIKSNVTAINDERTKISLYILEKYQNTDLNTKISLGTASGIDLLSGVGPKINVSISPAPSISTDVYNEFIEAGINQTIHRIMLEINVDTQVLLPSSSFNVKTSTSVCIAETVIVGEVPDAYTDIHRGEEISESDIDDIYDFGASAD